MENSRFKFRGKSLTTGEWVYGYGMIYDEENDIYQIIHRQGQNLTQHTQVDPKTLGQYIGLTDKNKSEIYMDDIVRIHYIDETAQIFKAMKERQLLFVDLAITKSMHGFLGVCYETLLNDDDELSFSENFCDIKFLAYLYKKECLEVIGNIYEHSHLLAKILPNEL